MLPFLCAFALATVLAISWAIALHWVPGRIIIDSQAGTLQRVVKPFFRRRVIVAPLAAWSVRVVYFNEADRQRRVFKRLELRGPSVREVVLFTDLKRGEELAVAFEQVHRALGSYNAEIAH